jgi:hypothetical protein
MSIYNQLETNFTSFAHSLSKPNAQATDTIRAVMTKRESFGPVSVPLPDGVTPMNLRDLFEGVIYNELWTSPELISRRGEIAELFNSEVAQ